MPVRWPKEKRQNLLQKCVAGQIHADLRKLWLISHAQRGA
jgi:hypothetical protein